MAGRLEGGVERHPGGHAATRPPAASVARSRVARRSLPALIPNSASTREPGGAAEPQAQRRIADQPGERRRERGRIVRRHQQAVDAVRDQLGDRGDPAGDRRQLHRARLEQHVRQAVAIAVGGDPARQHEQVGAAIARQHLIVRQRAAPADPSGDAERRRPGLERRAQRPAADMLVAPVQPGRQRGERRQQPFDPLLRHQPGDPQQPHRPRRIAAVGPRRPARRRKARRVEPVIGQEHLGGRRQRAQMLGALRAAGGQPAAFGELLALLPFGRGPDVLGMGRAAPVEPGQPRGIAGHRGRGVQIVGVEQPDVRRQLGRQHQRLAEAPHPVGGRVAPQIAQPQPARRGIGRPAPHPAPGGGDPRRLLVEILRQIDHRRGDRPVQVVHRRVGRVAQRDDGQREAAALERQDLLRDEGLGQPRIALDHDRDAGAGSRHQAGPAGAAQAKCRRRAAVRGPASQGADRSAIRSRPLKRSG